MKTNIYWKTPQFTYIYLPNFDFDPLYDSGNSYRTHFKEIKEYYEK